MTEYLYRVQWRYKPEHIPAKYGLDDNVWQVVNDKSYNNITAAKIVKSQHEHYMQTPGQWINGKFITESECEYRFQRYPLTQTWAVFNVD